MDLAVSCFGKSRLLSGYKDVLASFPPSNFNADATLRDSNLPQITINYEHVNAVLSLPNLDASRGAPFIIQESVINAQQCTFGGYMDAGTGFRNFYFALGVSEELKAPGTPRTIRITGKVTDTATNLPSLSSVLNQKE